MVLKYSSGKCFNEEVKAMKPYKTLKTVLVHPKDKQEKEYLTECVYKAQVQIQAKYLWSALNSVITEMPNYKQPI